MKIRLYLEVRDSTYLDEEQAVARGKGQFLPGWRTGCISRSGTVPTWRLYLKVRDSSYLDEEQLYLEVRNCAYLD